MRAGVVGWRCVSLATGRRAPGARNWPPNWASPGFSPSPGRFPGAKWDAYAAADVLVAPSRRDYRSLVGFEALACGLPVIASVYDGAAEEVVEPGSNGFIVDPHDADALAASLAWFVDRPEARPQMAAASRRIARRFTVERVVANLVEAGRLALSRPPG